MAKPKLGEKSGERQLVGLGGGDLRHEGHALKFQNYSKKKHSLQNSAIRKAGTGRTALIPKAREKLESLLERGQDLPVTRFSAWG